MYDAPTLPATLDRQAGRVLVSLARETIERCVSEDSQQKPRLDDIEPADSLDSTHEGPYENPMEYSGGAFVTIERGEKLRGCIGHIDPPEDPPVWRVVRDAAIDAALHDPRCRPVEYAELDEITVSVTVLSTPQSVSVDEPEQYPDAIEVGRDGLIVSSAGKRGVLLPQVAVDHDWDEPTFLTATCKKAGLQGTYWREGNVTVERFTARTFEERAPAGEITVNRFDRLEADGGHPVAGEREPAVAGRFYAGSTDALDEQIRTCFDDEYGPGSGDESDSATESEDDSPLALVSPHAGYPFSGPIAAHGFATLSQDVDTAIVLGPNHSGNGVAAAIAPHTSWRTPLGSVAVDTDLAASIVDRSEVATFDDRTHAGEHSIEVQLPLLQHRLDDIAVVPVCLTRLGRTRAETLGYEIASVVDNSDRTVMLISSTDLTHYIPHESAVRADKPVVEAIENFDTDAIERAVTEENHTMCGPWATVAGLTAARELGATDGQCLQYATSGQTGGDRSQVVGYCSVALR